MHTHMYLFKLKCIHIYDKLHICMSYMHSNMGKHDNIENRIEKKEMHWTAHANSDNNDGIVEKINEFYSYVFNANVVL